MESHAQCLIQLVQLVYFSELALAFGCLSYLQRSGLYKIAFLPNFLFLFISNFGSPYLCDACLHGITCPKAHLVSSSCLLFATGLGFLLPFILPQIWALQNWTNCLLSQICQPLSPKTNAHINLQPTLTFTLSNGLPFLQHSSSCNQNGFLFLTHRNYMSLMFLFPS